MKPFPKVPLSTLILALVLSLVVGHGLVYSDDEDPGDAQPAAGGMPGVTPEMLELVTPGKHHAEMKYFLGEWDVTMKMTMPHISMPDSTASASFQWLIDGRWMTQEIKGTMFDRPYHGFGIHGYDNMRRNHVTAWISNFDTSLGVVRGTVVDPTGKVTAEYGRMDEWMTGEYDKPVKIVTKKQTPDKWTMEIWDLGVGEAGMQVLVYTYTRKK